MRGSATFPSVVAGYGSAVNAFEPFDAGEYGDVVLWLKRETLAPLGNGSRVATWPDSSGEGNDATQATEARRMYYDESGVVRVRENVNQCVVTPEIITGQAFTIFVLATYQPPVAGDGDTYDALIGFNAQGEADGGGWFIRETGKSALYLTNGGGFDSYDATGALTYTRSSSFRVFELISDGVTLTTYCDGVLDGSCAVGASRAFTGKLTIGCAPIVDGPRGYPGAYREVLVYNEALDTGARASVRAWLSSRAAISKERWLYPTWSNPTTGALQLVEAWPGGLVGCARPVTFTPASIIGTGDYAFFQIPGSDRLWMVYSNTRVWLSNTQTLGLAYCDNPWSDPAVFTEVSGGIDVSSAPTPNYHCAAPDPFIDDDGTLHLVFQGINAAGDDFQPLIITSTDNDPEAAWSTPQTLSWNGTRPPMIDPFLRRNAAGLYELWYKYENTGWTEVATASAITGPYTLIKDDDWAIWGGGFEGPNLIELSGKNRLLVDDSSGGGNGMYWSESADNTINGPWSALAQIGLFVGGVARPRHCTPIRLTAP